MIQKCSCSTNNRFTFAFFRIPFVKMLFDLQNLNAKQKKQKKKQTESSKIFRVAEPPTDPLTFYLVPPAG